MDVPVDRLTRLANEIVRHAGGSDDEAEIVSRHLVDANLAGHDSHGVGMLPAYTGGIAEGRLKPGAHAEVVLDKGAYVLIDGNRGFGQVVAREAMQITIAKAKEMGLAVSGLRNSYHIGRVGAWGEMCADAGFISIHYVNALSPNSLVAPFGGTEARFTTNPYCTAIPESDRHPRLVLDMATSNVAAGKVRVAYLKGVEVPENSLIDHTGQPTNDPSVLFTEPRGAMRSMGEHKGYGLALICDILAGAFTGGGAFELARVATNKIVNNMLTIVLDPDVFAGADSFRSEVDRFTDWVKSSAPAAGVDEVMVPGDPERKARAAREANGIPIDDGTMGALLETAEKVGLGRDQALRILGN